MKRADQLDKLVGHNIRALRLSRGLSQHALSRRLGISFQQLQKYEKGENRIGSGRLWRVAQTLKVPIAALYEGAGDTGERFQSPLHLIARPDAMNLVQAFDKIDNGLIRSALVALVRRLAVWTRS